MLQALPSTRIVYDITSTHDSQNDRTIHDLPSSSTRKLDGQNITGIYQKNPQVTRPSPCSLEPISDSDDEDTCTSDSDAENLFSASSSSSDATSLSLSRPTSSCGYYYDDDSDTDQDCDATVIISPSSTKARLTLTPFFDIDNDLNLTEERPSLKADRPCSCSTHEPGTPALCKDSFDWETRTLVRHTDNAEDGLRWNSSRVDDCDDEDDCRTNGDDFDPEDWPDEMDSDDFPILHTWSHSWIWNPAPSASSPFSSLPSIRFEPVESLPPDQSSWTPLQDFHFGLRLTLPGHQAYNVWHPPMVIDRDANDDDDRVPAPCAVEWDAPTTYSETLGRSLVTVMSLQRQEAEGVRSLPVTSRRRRQARSLKTIQSWSASEYEDDSEIFIYRCVPEDDS
ncbi:hypothetical protein FRB96_004692 [Tulasnella sp. 330]|nr:hypothetical protein FRB96_004692 [Tulasnella sp. 330]KAG8877150.1 hypothetical protein FRB97_003640 [Tulasnella sp. 331]KAG8888599.1 hypothetical protein FRB98_007363 [Tulasnella sp. 332]